MDMGRYTNIFLRFLGLFLLVCAWGCVYLSARSWLPENEERSVYICGSNFWTKIFRSGLPYLRWY